MLGCLLDAVGAVDAVGVLDTLPTAEADLGPGVVADFPGMQAILRSRSLPGESAQAELDRHPVVLVGVAVQPTCHIFGFEEPNPM